MHLVRFQVYQGTNSKHMVQVTGTTSDKRTKMV